MPASSSPPDSGLHRHPIRLVVGVFLAQLAAIAFLSDRSPIVPRADSRSSRFFLITDPATEQRLASALVSEDPALFAGASRHGFSGSAWLSPQRRRYDMADWNEPPFRLAQPTNDLRSDAFEDRSLPPGDSAPLVSKPPPRLSGIPEQLEATPERSSLRIEGPLSQRPLARSVALPAWTNTSVVRPNIVEAVVGPEGDIRSTRLLVPSGLTHVDQEALRLSKEVRFAPDSPGLEPQDGSTASTVGWLVFDWATVAPPRANPLSR
jgi:hypothetical protein